MNQEKETSFFKKLVMSITSFEKYPELASKKWGAVLSYMIKLLAIFTVVVSFCSVYTMSKEVGQGLEYIEKDIPNFTFKDNTLNIETDTPIILENNENIFDIVILDTNTEISEETIDGYKEKLKKVINGIIFLNNKLIVKTELTTNGVVEYEYSTIASSYQIQNFDKQYLLNYFSGANLAMIYVGMFFMTSIYMMLIYFISIWLDIILLGTFGYLAALFMRLHLRYSAMCKIAVHSLTLPILLNALAVIIETFTEFKITYFEIMYMGISCIYIVAAILMIKSDVVKGRQELAKIIEEQEKVKMEMDKQKEEEERQKEEQRREEQKREKENKRKNEKKEKEDEQDKNVGDEPQGENA